MKRTLIPVTAIASSLFIFISCIWINASIMHNVDFGWSVRNGYGIVHYGFRAFDSYSWTVAGINKVSHAEWGTDVILYLINKYCGWFGIYLLPNLIGLAIVALAFYKQRGKDLNFFFISLGFLVFMSRFMTDRAQIFSYLFIALYLFFENKRLWLWFLFVPLWANLHGEYFLFIVIFGVDQIAKKNFKNMLYIPVWLLEVFLLTPGHFNTLIYPFQTLFSNEIKNYISEWEGYPFHQNLYFAIFMIIVIWIYFIVKNMTLDKKIMLFVLFMLSMDAIRNLPLLGVFLIFNTPVTKIKIESKYIDKFLFTLFLFSGIFASVFNKAPVIGLANPKAFSYIESHHLENLNWFMLPSYGDYADYYDHNIKVYMDGRTDVFIGMNGGKNILKPFFDAYSGIMPIYTLPDYSHIDGFIVTNPSVLNTELMMMGSEWRLALSLKNADIFLKVKNK